MSDLENAINSINESAAKAENTATFLDDMSTFDDQSSVTNPNNGKTVASIPKQVKDRTDELFTAAESDINQAVADAAQSATDAQDAATQVAQDKQDVQGIITSVTEDADRAEVAADAATLSGNIYADTASGLAVTVDGDYFSVVSSDDDGYLDLYLNDSGTAIFKKRYPSVKAISRDRSRGVKIGWHDTFFRQFKNGELVSYFDKPRTATYYDVGDINYTVSPSDKYKNANMLVKTVNTLELSYAGAGFLTYLDDIEAVEGDDVTFTTYLRVGSGGTQFRNIYQFYNDEGGKVGSFVSSTTTLEEGVNTISYSATVPAGATRIVVWVLKIGSDIKIDSFWTIKGLVEDTPTSPIFGDTPWLYEASKYQGDFISEASDTNSQQSSDIQYIIDKKTIVTGDSESIEIGVENDRFDISYGSPFTGWGEEYTTVSGVSFNAINIKKIARRSDVDESGIWATLNVQVRTSDTDSRSGEIVALGSIEVDPDETSLSDTRILLTDPATGEPITLDSSSMDLQYFVGIYARNSSGGAAYISPHRAEQSNTLGQSFYGTSAAADGGNITSTFSTNWRLGVEHLLIVNPIYSFDRSPSAKFINAIESTYTDPTRQNSESSGAWFLRTYKEKVAKLDKDNDELVIAFIGDSWTNSGYRIAKPVADWLESEYGLSSTGYISASASAGNPWEATKLRTGTWDNSANQGSVLYGPEGYSVTTSDLSATLKVTPVGGAVRYIIHYLQKPSGGEFEYVVSGNAPVTVSTDGAIEYKTLEIAESGGFIEISIVSTGLDGVTISGIDHRKDTLGQCVTHKLGFSGGTVAKLLAVPEAAYATAINSLGIDVAVICFGTNENSANIPPGEFKDNLVTLTDRLLSINPLMDIALVSAGPNNLVREYEITEYGDAMFDLARDSGFAFLDLYKHFGNFSDANSRGLYEDGVHPNADGGRVIGRAIVKSLLDK